MFRRISQKILISKRSFGTRRHSRRLPRGGRVRARYHCPSLTLGVHVVLACALIQVCELKGKNEPCLHDVSTGGAQNGSLPDPFSHCRQETITLKATMSELENLRR